MRHSERPNRLKGASIRAFIAIELPSELTEALRGLQALFSDGGLKNKEISWVKPENIHLTVKFLGDVEERRIPDIFAALEKAADGIRPFTLRAAGVGTFPKGTAPRVLWVGINGCPELKKLHSGIEEALKALGFPEEERDFSPHLTLCRIKTPPAGRALMAAQNIRPDINMDFMASSFVLFKSELSPTGAKYVELKRVAFE